MSDNNEENTDNEIGSDSDESDDYSSDNMAMNHFANYYD